MSGPDTWHGFQTISHKLWGTLGGRRRKLVVQRSKGCYESGLAVLREGVVERQSLKMLQGMMKEKSKLY